MTVHVSAGAAELQTFDPVARFTVLVSNGKDVRARIAGLADDRIVEAMKVVYAQVVVDMRPKRLVLDQQIADALELGKERLGDGATCMLRVVDRSLAKLAFGLRMKPEAHARRARTRASASSPGTMATLPARTSSRRALAASSQATSAGDLGSKLAMRRSTSLARSSGARLRAWAARSSTGVDMANLMRRAGSMPQDEAHVPEAEFAAPDNGQVQPPAAA